MGSATLKTEPDLQQGFSLLVFLGQPEPHSRICLRLCRL